MQVRPRSGLALKHGITCLNTPGTIDHDYRGEVKVILANLGNEPFEIRRGERIAQLVPAPVTKAAFREVGRAEQDQPRGRGLRQYRVDDWRPVSLSDEELERYARHIVLPQVGGVGQRKLKRSQYCGCRCGGHRMRPHPSSRRRGRRLPYNHRFRRSRASPTFTASRCILRQRRASPKPSSLDLGRTVGQLELRQRPGGVGRLHRGDAILAAGLHVLAHQRLHGAARHEHAELGLQQADFDVFPVHLRIACFERGAVELLRGQLQPPMDFE